MGWNAEPPVNPPERREVHNCSESDWRWVDCDECETCEIRVCVECGADIEEYDGVPDTWQEARGLA